MAPGHFVGDNTLPTIHNHFVHGDFSSTACVIDVQVNLVAGIMTKADD